MRTAECTRGCSRYGARDGFYLYNNTHSHVFHRRFAYRFFVAPPPLSFVSNKLINGQRHVVRRFIDGSEELNVIYYYYFVRVWARVVDLALYDGDDGSQRLATFIETNNYNNHCATFTRTIIIL